MVGGKGGTEGLRSRAGRIRPNWWVILAVSLALMALLVATAGGRPQRTDHTGALAGDSAGAGHRPHPVSHGAPDPAAGKTSTPTTTTSTTAPGAPMATSSSALVASRPSSSTASADGASPTTTTATPPAPASAPASAPVTTTTAPAVAQPADRTQSEGYLDPPVQTSTGFGFTGTGAMNVSVVWAGSTYLTMTVSCADGTQTVGGTSAMEASLPAAAGSCRATVSEPASESAAVTFTISIGPAGG